MKILFSNLALLVLSQLLTGCELVSTKQESAAHIPVHTDESLAELRQSAKALFNGRDITISNNAFANSNQLLIQRAPIQSPDGTVIDTRIDEAPFVLELLLIDGMCYLRNNATNEEVRLVKADCTAI